MPGALEADVIATTSLKKAVPPQLAKYAFKPGEAHVRSPGRPKGSRDAATIYLESLPLKAKQWVKSTNPAVLIDARKLAIPDADTESQRSPQVIVFLGASPIAPRLLDAADVSPTVLIVQQPPLMPAIPVAAQGISAIRRDDDNV